MPDHTTFYFLGCPRAPSARCGHSVAASPQRHPVAGDARDPRRKNLGKNTWNFTPLGSGETPHCVRRMLVLTSR